MGTSVTEALRLDYYGTVGRLDSLQGNAGDKRSKVAKTDAQPSNLARRGVGLVKLLTQMRRAEQL